MRSGVTMTALSATTTTQQDTTRDQVVEALTRAKQVLDTPRDSKVMLPPLVQKVRTEPELTSEMLLSHDEAERDYAAFRLDLTQAENRRAVTKLLESEASDDVLSSALINLARHGVCESAHAARRLLVSHSNPVVRLDAARLVGTVLRDPNSRDALAHAAKSAQAEQNEHLRREATIALWAIDAAEGNATSATTPESQEGGEEEVSPDDNEIKLDKGGRPSHVMASM